MSPGPCEMNVPLPGQCQCATGTTGSCSQWAGDGLEPAYNDFDIIFAPLLHRSLPPTPPLQCPGACSVLRRSTPRVVWCAVGAVPRRNWGPLCQVDPGQRDIRRDFKDRRSRGPALQLLRSGIRLSSRRVRPPPNPTHAPSRPHTLTHAHAHTHTHTLSVTLSLCHSLTHSLTPSLAPSLPRSLAPSLPRSLAPSITLSHPSLPPSNRVSPEFGCASVARCRCSSLASTGWRSTRSASSFRVRVTFAHFLLSTMPTHIRRVAQKKTKKLQPRFQRNTRIGC